MTPLLKLLYLNAVTSNTVYTSSVFAMRAVLRAFKALK